MKKPKEDSDLVCLIKQLESQRLTRQIIQDDLKRIEQDSQKVLEYFQAEQKKLDQQRQAAWREMRVLEAKLGNTEEVLRGQISPQIELGGCCVGKSVNY